MNEQQKVVLAAALGFIGGVALAGKVYKDVAREHDKEQAKMQMIVTHMLDDFAPYVPEEVLATTREKMQFDAIVIEEEGIKK